jgi:hypothetical protein
MKVRIRNLLGVTTADMVIPETGIALVAGLNGAGKSSVLEAIRCAALGTHATRGVTTKRAAETLLHDGAESGSATLDWGTGSSRVSWPDATATTKGTPRDLGTGLGIGARLWMSLEAKARQAEFAARFGGEPTVEDIEAFLEAFDGGDATKAEGLHQRVAEQGWDATLLAAKEKATKLKGGWEQVTGDRWGPEKARVWRPAALDPDEPYLPEETAAAVAAAREKVAALEARGTVEGAEMVRLRGLAAEFDARTKAVEQAREAQRPLDAACEALLARKPPEPGAAGAPRHKCPHCGKPLQVGRSANGALVVNAPSAAEASEEARKKAEAAFSAWQGETDEAQTVARAAQATIEELVAEVRESARARDQLEKLREAGGRAKPVDLAAARTALTEAEAINSGVQAMLRARGLFNDWALCQPLIAALSPDGVRRVVAARALEAVNADLATVSAMAGWADVALTADLDLTLGGRLYPLLSESEQWRADTTMTLVLAKREGAALVTLDRLDVLERSCRPGALRAVVGWGIPAVIAVTAPDRAQGTLPGLKAAGAGACWWVSDGEMQELPW